MVDVWKFYAEKEPIHRAEPRTWDGRGGEQVAVDNVFIDVDDEVVR